MTPRILPLKPPTNTVRFHVSEGQVLRREIVRGHLQTSMEDIVRLNPHLQGRDIQLQQSKEILDVRWV